MKSIINFSLVLLLAGTVFSCKDKAANAADATESAANAEGTKFSVSPESAKITWEGSKPTGKHAGTINIANGELTVKDGALVAGAFTLDMNSITVTDLVGEEKMYLEGHLKGTTDDKEKNDHFFNVTQHPTAKFEVTAFNEKDGKATLEGNLTIKGISKSVSVPVTVTTTEDLLTINSEKFTINRTEWNINYSSKSVFDDLKDKFINDEIELTLKISAKK